MDVSAVILSGGRSQRFGGTHKPGVEVAGTAVISRILSAVVEAAPDAEIWVAGETAGLSASERDRAAAVREEPKFAGPLAGIAAAVTEIVASHGSSDSSLLNADEAAVTLIVAGDMPLVTPEHLGDLVSACAQSGIPAVGFDDRGSMQFLCAAWPTRLLSRRLSEIGDPANRAVKLLYRDQETVRVDVDPGQLLDFDTPEEFDRVRSRLEGAVEQSAERAGGLAPANPEPAAEQAAGQPPTRPVPEAVRRLSELVTGQAGEARTLVAVWDGISAADAEAVLDFAARIKHSDSTLSPVLAAFLAGAVHARNTDGGSVSEALAAVEAAVKAQS